MAPWSRGLRQETTKNRIRWLGTSALWILKRIIINLWPLGTGCDPLMSYIHGLGYTTEPNYAMVFFIHCNCVTNRQSHHKFIQNLTRHISENNSDENPEMHLRINSRFSLQLQKRNCYPNPRNKCQYMSIYATYFDSTCRSLNEWERAPIVKAWMNEKFERMWELKWLFSTF